jgi:RNA polymerase sigma-70 factor (ECF subfamily)
VFSILLNLARTRGKREHRVLPFAAVRERWQDRGPAVAPERFQGPGRERPGWWAVPPARWADPLEQLESAETTAALHAAIVALPSRQREALVLRDVLGLDAAETCTVMEVSDGNHRVLLHRARAKVRTALERHFAGLEAAR